jgi:hypothetical protein
LIFGHFGQGHDVARRSWPKFANPSDAAALAAWTHYVDIVGVTGSIPVAPTIVLKGSDNRLASSPEAEKAHGKQPAWFRPGWREPMATAASEPRPEALDALTLASPRPPECKCAPICNQALGSINGALRGLKPSTATLISRQKVPQVVAYH